MAVSEQDWLTKPRKVSILVDNDSWILPYASDLVDKINHNGDNAVLCRRHEQIEKGMVAFFLGCIHVTPKLILENNLFNLVVHESDLPEGKGFAPLTWQILEGKKTIPVCLIEAIDKVDSGPIYLRKELNFYGNELNDEIRHGQGLITLQLCLEFLEQENVPVAKPQTGKESFYTRRTPLHSELDVHKSIIEQFDLLRVVDNDRYPAFFEINGHTYILKIEKNEA